MSTDGWEGSQTRVSQDTSQHGMSTGAISAASARLQN